MSPGPHRASTSSVSTPAAPSMKCRGASTCVPVCVPQHSALTLATSPAAIDRTSSSETAGSPSKTCIPGRTGTLTSRIRAVTAFTSAS